MVASKVTLLFQAGTVDSGGNAARVAGFSETYYSILPITSTALFDNWTNLALKRAALLPTNSRIVGGRFQTVDPPGPSRQYDNVYVGSAGTLNDLPGVALQWTVRSPSTANQRSVILRSIPDARIVTGEYSPTPSYDAALLAYFAELDNNWQFRAIDRTHAPVRIIDITGSDSTMVTSQPHGLTVNDIAQIMSTEPDAAHPVSFLAQVLTVPNTTTATLFRITGNGIIQSSVRGRVRKYLIIYPNMSITNGEVLRPIAITRKVGAPFRKFRGRRTVRH